MQADGAVVRSLMLSTQTELNASSIQVCVCSIIVTAVVAAAAAAARRVLCHTDCIIRTAVRVPLSLLTRMAGVESADRARRRCGPDLRRRVRER